MSDLSSIEKRLAGVEGSLRRWKLGFAALALVAVGVAADGALKDAEFGTVRARSFQVVDEKGEKLGSFEIGKSGDHAAIGVITADKKKATIITPGKEPLTVDYTNNQ